MSQEHFDFEGIPITLKIGFIAQLSKHASSNLIN